MNILHSIKTTALVVVAMLTASSAWGDNVAKIGTTEYATLQAAIEAAPTDGTATTITLLADVSENISVAEGQNITLNMYNGTTAYTLNGGSKENKKAAITNYGTLTVQGKSTSVCGTIKRDDDDTGLTASDSYYVIDNRGTLTLKYVNVTNNSGLSDGHKGSSLIRNGEKKEGAKLTISYCTLTQPKYNVIKNSGEASLGYGTVVGSESQLNYAILTYGDFTISASSAKVYGPVCVRGYKDSSEDSNGTLTLKSGYIYGDITVEQYPGYPSSTNPSLSITGGYVTGTIKTGTGNGNTFTEDTTPGTNGSVSISGGQFAVAPDASFIAEGVDLCPSSTSGFGYKIGTAVAQIGDKKYASIADAMAAANEGDEIKLLADVVATPIDKKITLDLNGKTLKTSTIAQGHFKINSAATIKNGNIVLGGPNTIKVLATDVIFNNVAISTVKGASATVALVTFDTDNAGATFTDCQILDNTTDAKNNRNAGILVDANNVDVTLTNTTVNMNNANKTSDYAVVSNGSKSDVNVTIDNSTISGAKYGVYMPADGSLIIKDGSITGTVTGVENRGADLNISGDVVITGGTGEFLYVPNGGGTTTDNSALSITPYSDKTLKVEVTGGTFNGTQALYINNENNATVESAKVSGGTFNGNVTSTDITNFISGGTFSSPVPEDYCAEGFTPVTTPDADGKYTVYEGEPVAQIGDTKYRTLQDAVAAATEGAEIKVLTDVELASTLTIPSGKTITLDLNGKKITSTATDAIDNNGTLTLKDSGEGGSIIGKYTIVAESNSTTTIESGNYKSSEFTVSTDVKVTNATINISGGTFTATDNAVIAGDGTDRIGDANTFNITGGTFNGSITSSGYIACGIYAPWKDTFNVSGGTFNITNGAGIVARAGTINVTGGTFNCTGNVTGQVGAKSQALPCAAIVYDKTDPAYPAITTESQIKINGGEFNADVDAVQVLGTDETKRVAVSGGSFSSAVDPDNCAEGFAPKDNGDGTYGVTKEFIIVDNEPIPLDANKTLTNIKATYKRTMPTGTKWGTVCVPFTLTQGDGTSTPKLYTFDSISGSTLTVNEVEGTVAPGTPVLFYTGTNGVSVFSTEKATVNTAALSETTSGLIGTYDGATISSDLSNVYFINDDKFHQAKVSLTVPRYRAYIKYTATSGTPGTGDAKPSTLFINVGGETSAINAATFETLGTVAGYYTPDGTRHATPQPGLNIVRMTNGKTVKMMK